MTCVLAVFLGACSAPGAESSAPSPPIPSTPIPSTPIPTANRSPVASISATAPPNDATQQVINAALTTMAAKTFRYELEIRPEDPDTTFGPFSGTGQVSFAEPFQFRFSRNGEAGLAGLVPPWDVIFDGEQIFTRGPEPSVLPPDAWLVIDLGPPLATVIRRSLLSRYDAAVLVLVPPMGATQAVPAGEETVRGVTARRFVTEVDIELARPHLPEDALPAYERQLAVARAHGSPLIDESEVWLDPEGRIVRTRYRQDVASLAAPIVVTYEMTDFGAPMDIKPPEGAEVLTVAEAQEKYGTKLESPSPSS
jgi:hypothetical protein